MTGLHLIQTYSSDSDEEEDNKKENNDVKIYDKLVLPPSILSWKGVAHHTEVIDNPIDHDGRVRGFRHERGNWATLVYVNYIANDCIHAWMDSILNELPVKGNIISNLHISLSRTLVLKFHWIESFTESLKLLCHRFNRFILQLIDVRVYCNEEKTRTFLGIYCQNTDGTLNNFIKALNSLLAEYQLPSFYEDASYHISFFWCLGDERASLKSILPYLTCSINKIFTDNIEYNYVHINEVQCKIGNKCYVFELR